jgi:hypothetical protein
MITPDHFLAARRAARTAQLVAEVVKWGKVKGE